MLIGNTPLRLLSGTGNILPPRPNVFAKLEGENETGSMKIRSAVRIIERAGLKSGMTVVESTSGNMGTAIACVAKDRGLHAVLVVDPKLSPYHRNMILEFGGQLVEVMEVDDTGGWLKTRLAKVKSLLQEHPDWYWINQYESPWNPQAFESIGIEIVNQLCELPIGKTLWLFASVSTGGSLTGTARVLKSMKSFRTKVVAVDAAGSEIFGSTPCKRYLNGIGSSLSNPPNLDRSLIDFVSIATDREAFEMCHMLREEGIYAGGSSGAVLSAIYHHKFWESLDDVVVGIFPDCGEIYEQTLYSEQWLEERGFELHAMAGRG
jgi:N-(2-amino-2-carboxyethyl)-L-glutamate synthase